MIAVTKPFAAAKLPPRTEAAGEAELRMMLADLASVCSSASESLARHGRPQMARLLAERAARADALLQRHRP